MVHPAHKWMKRRRGGAVEGSNPPPSRLDRPGKIGILKTEGSDPGHIEKPTGLKSGGGVSASARRSAESKGDAMPGGRFPIRNAKDLSNAKHDFGRANDKPAVRRFIDKRAKALGKPAMGES